MISLTKLIATFTSVITLFVCSLANSTELGNWTRIVGSQSNVPGLRLLPLYVESVGELSGHIFGTCRFYNHYDNREPRRLPVEVRTDGEELWVIALLQVGNNINGPWEAVGSTTGNRGEVFKIQIDPEERSPQLKVDLEPYRSYIGKYKFGRIAIEPDVGAVFELEDLRTPTPGK